MCIFINSARKPLHCFKNKLENKSKFLKVEVIGFEVVTNGENFYPQANLITVL